MFCELHLAPEVSDAMRLDAAGHGFDKAASGSLKNAAPAPMYTVRDKSPAMNRAASNQRHPAETPFAEFSAIDPLTGLHNRRYLIDRVTGDVVAIRLLHEQRRADAMPPVDAGLVFLVIDIDLKTVNDRYGRSAGDRVLQQFARLLQGVCRQTDTAVRWGGEEFMLLVRCTTPDSGGALAERIRTRTAAHAFRLDDGTVMRHTCSIGFASVLVSASSAHNFWEDAVELAEQCLDRAKRGGRDTWVGVFCTADVPHHYSRLDLDGLLAVGVAHLCFAKPLAKADVHES